jgi:hypothetical protein
LSKVLPTLRKLVTAPVADPLACQMVRMNGRLFLSAEAVHAVEVHEVPLSVGAARVLMTYATLLVRPPTAKAASIVTAAVAVGDGLRSSGADFYTASDDAVALNTGTLVYNNAARANTGQNGASSSRELLVPICRDGKYRFCVGGVISNYGGVGQPPSFVDWHVRFLVYRPVSRLGLPRAAIPQIRREVQ